MKQSDTMEADSFLKVSEIEDQNKISRDKISNVSKEGLDQNNHEQENTSQNQWNTEKYLSFLKVNNWKIESLVEWEEWQLLNSDQQHELESLCQQELAIQKAKQWLKSNKQHQVNEILKQEQFISLQHNKKFKEWIKNQNYYQKKRLTKNKVSQNDNLSTILSFSSQSQPTKKQNFIDINEQPLTSLTAINNCVINENFHNIAQEKWNKLVKNCEKSSYKERVQLFQDHYYQDPLTFIQLIKEYSKEVTIQNMFSILMSIICQLEHSHEKTNLLTASFRYYNFEAFREQQQHFFLESSFNMVIKKLQMEKYTEEVVGFFNFLFCNHFQLQEEQINEITILCLSCGQAWKNFIAQLQQNPFNIRSEVAQRLPKSGQFFKPTLNSIFKETRGQIFLQVNEEYRTPLIEIFVYSGENQYDHLKQFISNISDYIQGYTYILEKSHFIVFLYALSEQMKIKSVLWYQNIQKVNDLTQKIISGIIEQKIIDVKPIMGCLNGDHSSLQNELSKTKMINSGGLEEIQNIFVNFKQRNQSEVDVQNYQIEDFKEEVQQLFTKIQNEFGRPFHNIQTFCIKYVLSILGKALYFFQFGLGNGKTLISSSLSILVSSIIKMPVIIVVKSQYLLQRDFNKFKSLIYSCGLQASLQAFNQKGVTFMDDKTFFKKFKRNCDKIQRNQLERNICVILDEYDTIFDENKPQLIAEKLLVLRQFQNLIGFTGSPLSSEQNQCLIECLVAKVISFPIMHEIYGQNVYQRRSFIFTRDQQWFENLSQTILSTINDVPVLVALYQQDVPKVKEQLKTLDIPFFDLTILLKKQKLSELQTIIDCQFNQRLQNNLYGVFIINQEIGRGTDFPSSQEIENNGGIYLIMGDIFGFRQTAQIKGRVGRMQNKGQFQYIVSMKEGGNIYDYISHRQNILYLNEQKILKMYQI